MRIAKLITVLFLLITGLKSIIQDFANLKTKEDTLQLLVQKITEDGGLSSAFVGAGGAPSMQYKFFIYLLHVASNDDLVRIIENYDGGIRLYAFMGLLYKKYDRSSQIKELLQNDTTKIGTIAGCVVKSSTVKNEVESISKWFNKEYVDTVLHYLDKYVEFNNDYFEQIILYKTYKELEREKANSFLYHTRIYKIRHSPIFIKPNNIFRSQS